MTTPRDVRSPDVLTLAAATAADLMTSDPVSIGKDATVKEAAALLSDRGISAAPVIDEAGRPVGVVSRADIVLHHRQSAEYLPVVAGYYETADLTTPTGEPLPAGFQTEWSDQTTVQGIMTPVVFAVPENAPARRVVADMIDKKVHRLFVLDSGGVLVGVISALDVLRHLR